MFAYNKLSDLTNGELVTPISTNGDTVLCLDSNGNNVSYSFDDFDFSKQENDRTIIKAASSMKEAEETVKNSNDAIYIIEENIEVSTNPIENSLVITAGTASIVFKKSSEDNEYGFIKNNKTKKKILSIFDYKYTNIDNIKIYREKTEV